MKWILLLPLIVGCVKVSTSVSINPTPAAAYRPLCDDPRLPSLGQSYCVGQNKGAAPAKFPPPLPIDFDGTCPTCGFTLKALPNQGVEYTLRGSISPYPGKKEVDYDLVRSIPDSPNGLVGFVTRYDRIEVSGLHGNVMVSPAIWFRAKGDTRTCANPHSWISVTLSPARPIAPAISRDVMYKSRNSYTCGQIYQFNATGPTIGWKPGTPLVIDWSHLLDVIHQRGWWSSIQAKDAYSISQFAGEIAGFTPGGKPASANGTQTGGATVRFWNWQ